MAAQAWTATSSCKTVPALLALGASFFHAQRLLLAINRFVATAAWSSVSVLGSINRRL